MKKYLSLLAFIVAACIAMSGCSAFGMIISGNKQSSSQQTTSKNESLQEQASVGYKAGVITANKYTSQWLGVMYTLGDDMVMATAEEMYSLSSRNLENFGSDTEKLQSTLEAAKKQANYEMMAIKTDGTGNIIILTEKSNFIGMTADQYRSIFETQLKTNYTNAKVISKDNYDICGATYSRMDYTLEVSGSTINQTSLVRKMGNYFVVMTVTCTSENGFESIMKGFTAL